MIKSIVLTKFCDILVILFNGTMKTSYFPKCWKTGFIVPIFKSGESSDPGNYRRITITSCFGKIFTLITNERLLEFLNHKRKQLMSVKSVSVRAIELLIMYLF